MYRALARHAFKPFHTDDDGADSQAGSNNDQRKRSAVDILDHYGRDALKLAEKVSDLESDNYRLRERNRRLSSDNETLKTKAPADGALVLSADDAQKWQAYAALGSPDDLKQAVETARTSSDKLAHLEREQTLRNAADIYGYKANVLSRLPSLADKTIELREETDDKGAKVKRAYVENTALDAYITQHEVPEFVSSLTAADAAQNHAQRNGTSFVKQPSTQGANGGDLVSQFLAAQDAQREKQPNPLSPTRA